MTYEHPLAYVIGLEGLALLRSFAGEHDREFVTERIAEVRRLLDDKALANAAVEVAQVDAAEGYRVWSRTYDEGRNTAFDIDEPLVDDILDNIPLGVALDAACGTGRWAGRLAARGHRVIGVDGSPDMLAHARNRVPVADLRLGELDRLPVEDDAVDLVVCTLALTHVRALGPVFAEFARVVRPGGHVVIADMHPERLRRGMIPSLRRDNGQPARLASYHHLVGDYLRAALAAGLELRGCVEPTGDDNPKRTVASTELGPWEVWPWSLADLVPEAAHASSAGVPVMIVWHFRAPARPTADTHPSV